MKLIIPAPVERKLHAYVKAVDGEIAGMGEIEVRDDGNLWVVDVAIYDQEVTGGTADLSSSALAHFQTDLIRRGKSPKNWYLWWHSHANMSAFFSTTDTGTIDTSTEFNHVVSLVVNKRRERKARLDTHTVNGVPMRITVDNITIEVPPEVNQRTIEIDELIKELEKEKDAVESVAPEGIAEEVAEKVKQKVWVRPVGFHAQGNQQPDRKFLELPFNDNWSKKRKKDGTVTTVGEIIEGLDEDELWLAIDLCQQMIKVHEANGNGDSVECEELRVDLDIYYEQLIESQVETYAEGRDNPDNSYWDGTRWVKVWEDLDKNGYPKLPAPYNSPDDERD